MSLLEHFIIMREGAIMVDNNNSSFNTINRIAVESNQKLIPSNFFTKMVHYRRKAMMIDNYYYTLS